MKRERTREMNFPSLNSEHPSPQQKNIYITNYPPAITNTAMEHSTIKVNVLLGFSRGKMSDQPLGCKLNGIRVCWQFISSKTVCWTLYLCRTSRWNAGQIELFPWRNPAFNHLLDVWKTICKKGRGIKTIHPISTGLSRFLWSISSCIFPGVLQVSDLQLYRVRFEVAW